MILDAVTKKLEVILAGAVTANQLPFVCTWSDIGATSALPGENDGQTNGVTVVDLVPVPGSSTQRFVKTISIFNADTAAATVTVRYNNNATLRTIRKVVLQVGETLEYNGQWNVFDATGSVKTAQSGTGRWLRTVVLTSGTTHTTGPQTTSLFLRMVGGGGGGGGCSSLASAAAAAGGGGSGAYAEKTFVVTPSTNYTYAIGALGAGSSGAVGGNGTSTTFAAGGVTVTAPGGVGGPLATAATTLTARAGGAGAAISTNGDLNSTGSPGVYGVVLIVTGPILASGKGADSQFGSGGIGLVAVGAGSAATGFGAGGGGSATGAAAARAGGNGTAGVIIVDEYA
jgi:hypothetical protein